MIVVLVIVLWIEPPRIDCANRLRAIAVERERCDCGLKEAHQRVIDACGR